MLKIMAMASVIGGKFFSVYPNLKETAINAFLPWTGKYANGAISQKFASYHVDKGLINRSNYLSAKPLYAFSSINCLWHPFLKAKTNFPR